MPIIALHFEVSINRLFPREKLGPQGKDRRWGRFNAASRRSTPPRVCWPKSGRGIPSTASGARGVAIAAGRARKVSGKVEGANGLPEKRTRKRVAKIKVLRILGAFLIWTVWNWAHFFPLLAACLN